MKKKIFLFILLLGLFFSYTKAYAITGTYEHQDFKYTVKKIHLDIYKSKLDENNNFLGYEGEKVDSIDLEDKYTIDPQYIDKADDDSEYIHNVGTYIILNLNISKEEMLALVKTKVTASEENHYFIRLVVDFTLDKVPSTYKYFYQNVYDAKDNSFIFSTETNESSIHLEPIVLGNQISEVFSNFEYKLVGEEENINYATTYSKGMPLYLDFLLNGSLFSSLDEEKPQLLVPDGVEVETDDDVLVAKEKFTHSLIFIGYSNVEEYSQALAEDILSKIEEAFSKGFNTQTTLPQEVEVPDTAKGMNKIIIYVFGVLALILGFVVTFVTMKKVNN